MTYAEWLLAASALLQFLAAALALRLIRLTGRKRAWILIAAAFALMGLRRLVTLRAALADARHLEGANLTAEVIAVVISLLLLVGVALIGPLFASAQQSARAALESAERLTASERRYRFLIERIPQAFVVLLDGKLVFANRSFARIFGVPPEQALGRPFSEFVKPEYRARATTMTGSEAKSPSWTTVQHEVEICHARDDARWVDIRLHVAEWDGRPAEFGLIQDITERKRAEAAMAREERLFALGPVVLFRWLPSPGRTVSYVSRNVSQWGFFPDRLRTADDFYSFIHPDDRERIATQTRGFLAERRASWELEYRLVCPDGQTRWVYDCTVVGRDATGQATHLDGYVLDVSERRKVNAALLDSEERYRLAARATQDVLRDWNVETGSLLWNDNVESVLGYLPEEMGTTLSSWSEKLHPDDRERVGAEMQARLSSGETFLLEYRLRRRDGTYASVLDRGLVVRDPTGKALRVTAAITDLSLRKQLEEQLRLAQKIEALGNLAGGIAHDFNNLLTAILGSAELLQRRESGSGRHSEELTTIHRTATRAAELTRGLLAFARRQVLEPADFDLNKLIQGETPILRRLIPENITIDFIPGHQLGTVHADPGQLQQVLVNLCVNARDAMPDGGTITLETENVVVNGAYVSTHPWAHEGRYVMLTVSDNGHGMDRRVLEQVFDPFFTTKEPGRGTGLGLATVYGIVKQHNGMINAYSEPGSGSTFKVYLPLVARRAVDVGSKIEQPVVGGTETILVVEDEVEVRLIIVEVLAGLGYRVIEAEDGIAAIERMSASGLPVDLIITDVVMPRMGGKELREQVRAAAPETLFLFSSGYTENAIHRDFVKDDGVFFIAKPYGIDALARKVREVLDSRASKVR
ncbi:MAG: PAS domain-containing protein [Acidobacteria bacterium]|nr:PAS domain-containing protein [Acidobacteriota bacterium]